MLETPRLAIVASVTGIGQQEQFIPNTAVRYFSHRLGSLALTVTTNRDNASQNHGLLRGIVRQGMLAVTASMNANTVPYYQTIYVMEASSAQGSTSVNDEISTELTYAIQWQIDPAQWPKA